LDNDLTAYENMYFHAMLYNVPKKEIKTEIDRLINFVNLQEFKNKPVKLFSG
jgi:ABC-2 type transport system ATP-binding protein